VSALVTALGWAGAVMTISAYALVTRGLWSASSRRYQLANVAGALMMCTVAASSGVWPSVVANIAWALIGAHAVVVLVRARHPRAPQAAPATEVVELAA